MSLKTLLGFSRFTGGLKVADSVPQTMFVRFATPELSNKAPFDSTVYLTFPALKPWQGVCTQCCYFTVSKQVQSKRSQPSIQHVKSAGAILEKEQRNINKNKNNVNCQGCSKKQGDRENTWLSTQFTQLKKQWSYKSVTIDSSKWA